ncbi:MAG: rhodanese-like domain-containing protein [Chitinivibrionales bacterium]|nr:rhodanese-like domain-containing protein [Chitinivibrionales bacterium]
MQPHLKSLQKELNDNAAQLLDVRELDEWDAGHLRDARLVPLSQLRRGDYPADLDKSAKTYLHCRSGNRVRIAAPLLEKLGFERLIPLSEGYKDLVGAGFESSDNAS